MELGDVRKKINAIDEEIVRLFVERMKTTTEVAKVKAEQNIPVLDKTREREVLNKVMEMAGEDYELYINLLYHTLFDMSRSHQSDILIPETQLCQEIQENIKTPRIELPKKAVVACQGVEGSYASKACERLFPMGTPMHFNTFDSVFQAVENGLCDYGVLPIENSSAGSVTGVYDLMLHHKFYIVRSVKLHIHHGLVVKNGMKFEDIKEIISHEQALLQCSEFLKSLPEDVKITTFANTAVAAKHVAETDRTDIAAIASVDCTKLYPLTVLKDDVQNHENNYTKFICIAKNMEIYAGANKISLMLTLQHRPGALYDMLGKIACHGLNLSKISSRPIAGRDFEFRFYFDIDGSVCSANVVKLLKDMNQEADKLLFLGCYSDT